MGRELPPHVIIKHNIAIIIAITIASAPCKPKANLTRTPQDISTCRKLVHAHFGATELDSYTSLGECLVRQLRLVCNRVGRNFSRFDSWSPSTLNPASLDGDGNTHVVLMMAALYVIRCRCENRAGSHVGDGEGSEDDGRRRMYCCYAQASLLTAEMIEV